MPTTRSPRQCSTRRRIDLHRIARGGPVERLGGRCAPVDDQRFVVGVADADPADVADLTVGAVQPAEDQPFLLGVQHRQPPSGLEGEDVALVQTGAVLLANVGVAVGLIKRKPGSRDLLGGSGRLGEPGVHEIDMSLFDGQLALQGASGRRCVLPRCRNSFRSARVSRRMILTRKNKHLSIRKLSGSPKLLRRAQCLPAGPQIVVAAVRGQGCREHDLRWARTCRGEGLAV